MIRYGNDGIDQLATRLETQDPAASSHWRQQHADFKFDGNGFSGLRGFGGTGRARGLIRSSLHYILQNRYRRMAGDFEHFDLAKGHARDICKSQNRNVNLDVLRQAITLAYLRSRTEITTGEEARACVIGDGFSTLTSLLLADRLFGQVVLVNLTRTLLVDLWYLKLWLGEERFAREVVLVDDAQSMAAANSDSTIKVVALEAVNHKFLSHASIDFFANIASMQEMNPEVVAEYFDDIRKSAKRSKKSPIFYCCNRLEKTLEDGTTVRFHDYPWSPKDEVFEHELCPWHNDFYAVSWPVYRPYDGDIVHRLAKMSAVA